MPSVWPGPKRVATQAFFVGWYGRGMGDEMLERVYSTTDPHELADVYDQWAEDYDDDLAGQRYATPGRVAAALVRHTDGGGPVLDVGCGTGLSGVALAHAGFDSIDGYDVAPRMLEVARRTGVYRNLIEGSVGEPFGVDLSDYVVVAACGAISPGAAPAHLLDDIIAGLSSGAIFAVSLNEHALDEPDFVGRIEAAISDGRVDELEAFSGPHLPDRGLTSTVYVLRRV